MRLRALLPPGFGAAFAGRLGLLTGPWRARVRCLLLGHRWRQSESKAGYQTCQRCRVRRLPIS